MIAMLFFILIASGFVIVTANTIAGDKDSSSGESNCDVDLGEFKVGANGSWDLTTFANELRHGNYHCLHEYIMNVGKTSTDGLSSSSSSSSTDSLNMMNKEQLLIKLKETLDNEQKRVTKEVSLLKSLIDSSFKVTQIEQSGGAEQQQQRTIVPAFQWCQSANTIFINVKFSHKLDAPGKY
jgi:hypothetical protein